MTTQTTTHDAAGATGNAENWWSAGGPLAVNTASPLESVRQILVDAAGPGRDKDAEGNPVSDQVLLKRARVATHPDKHGGDQTAWDRVEAAAKTLGLMPPKRD